MFFRYAGLSVLVVAIGVATGAAEAQLYRWVDDNGRTVVSDMPPPGQIKHQEIRKAASPSPEPGATINESKDKPAGGEPKTRENGVSKPTQALCDQARQNLQALESGRPLSVTNERGERFPMDNTARANEMSKIQETIRNCPQN